MRVSRLVNAIPPPFHHLSPDNFAASENDWQALKNVRGDEALESQGFQEQWMVSDSQKQLNGGEGGIRTLGTVARTPHFECGAFDHSATSPQRT